MCHRTFETFLFFISTTGLLAQSYKHERNDNCYEERRVTTLLGLFSIRKRFRKRREVKSWPGIMYQCINLNVLDLSALTTEHQLKHIGLSGSQLANRCPLISHFILTRDEVEILDTFVDELTNNSNCIKIIEINAGWSAPNNYDYNQFTKTKVFEFKVSKILPKCKKLEKLYLDTILPEALINVLPRLTHLYLTCCAAIDIEIISKINSMVKSSNSDNQIMAQSNEVLQYLYCPGTDLTCYQLRDLLNNITYIRTLHIKSSTANMKYLKCLKFLNDLSWTQSDLEPSNNAQQRKEISDSFRSFCTTKGPSLKSFSLTMVSRVSADFLSPLEHLKNVSKLEIKLHSPQSDESRQPGINLTPFRGLNKLKLSWIKLTSNQVKKFLVSTMVLRFCKFEYCDLKVDVTHHFVNYFFCLHPMVTCSAMIVAKKSAANKGILRKIVRRSDVTIKYLTPFDPYHYAALNEYLALI